MSKYTQCPERQQRKSRRRSQVSYHIINSGKMEKVEVSVARYLRTPPYGANRKDLERNSRTAIRQREHIP
ncbi:hypothetical protein AGR6A_Cc60161 [Agrobacterium sp. NCPPB 925]|nr:hypothetical protein AGR6A_Cc60161 [Agrobacterium sp. NCPPB 925]